ncbi:MAG: hypothetical protein CMJ81_21175 [Planctomycetaceae bacterium]|nr:hypothetical protein [Planctomycetaceae bacterium]
MKFSPNTKTTDCLTRRHFLQNGAFSLAPLAVASLLQQEQTRAESAKPVLEFEQLSLASKEAHFAPRATAMISLFMQGGPSHVDLLDPKVELTRLDGKKFPGKLKYDDAGGATTKILGSPWKFKPRGQCGTEVSELLPHLSGVVDELVVIRSMRTGVNNHSQSIHSMNSGRIQQGHPSLGSWITYGLGAETEQLPAFVAMTDPKGLPVEGVLNWSNGWLPSLYQGTVIRPREPRILNLEAPTRLRGRTQRNYLDFLQRLNREHVTEHADQGELQARIANFELAARMQTAALTALDIRHETVATHRLYGIDRKETQEYGTRCLIARRLIERGVRFVQLFTQNQYWDHHKKIVGDLPTACLKTDQPIAGLMVDLKQRGLLDSTIVHWGGEMGRLPVIENDSGRDKIGRDHNTYGFSMWLAGGGCRAGCTYGNTDEFGHHAVENPVNHFDYHATLLHLLGLDSAGLTYQRNGQEDSLLSGHPGKVVTEILA